MFTPVNIKLLTNISVVRLKTKSKTFEIACYPNKVKDWRNNLETDLENVLQTNEIYTDVQ